MEQSAFLYRLNSKFCLEKRVKHQKMGEGTNQLLIIYFLLDRHASKSLAQDKRGNGHKLTHSLVHFCGVTPFTLGTLFAHTDCEHSTIKSTSYGLSTIKLKPRT